MKIIDELCEHVGSRWWLRRGKQTAFHTREGDLLRAPRRGREVEDIDNDSEDDSDDDDAPERTPTLTTATTSRTIQATTKKTIRDHASWQTDRVHYSDRVCATSVRLGDAMDAPAVAARLRHQKRREKQTLRACYER